MLFSSDNSVGLWPIQSHVSKVVELIDYAHGCGREDLIKRIFLPCDADIILTIPLSLSWPEDKLICHYAMVGGFSVRSAYHLRIQSIAQDGACSSHSNMQVWKTIWSLNIPPRIKVFAW